ncbi:MAG TPA: excinuclease ABC subunit UvrA [archaeon]|nr:excinuclease ABC subunit UvrA [archaeon]
MDVIRIKGAREHNLKNIDLELPREKLVVVSGVSGSGKSSLVFDTIYQESRRRFLETLPTYVLQFMERMPRPDVDWLEGLSPAVAVEQRNPVNTSRSTVGTITEIYDYLRLLYARAGETVCPVCGGRVSRDTTDSIASRIYESCPGRVVTVAFAPAVSERITAQTLRESLLSLGFIRVLQGQTGDIFRLDEPETASRLDPRSPLYVVVDRIMVRPESRSRLGESVSVAFRHGEGLLFIFPEDSKERLGFSERYHCAACDCSYPEPVPNLFSFNNPYGACPTCRGFGNLLDYDLRRIVRDPGRSLEQGALDPWTKPRYEGRRLRLASFCKQQGIDMRTPWNNLPEDQKKLLLESARGFEGVIPFLHKLERKKYKQYIRFFLRSYQSERTCPDCSGGRLRKEVNNVFLAGRNISELTGMSIQALSEYFARLPDKLTPFRLEAVSELIQEVRSRLDFLLEVGLSYLTLSRLTRTLSGGEYQRIMLTRLLGSGLTDTLFVLDEPTIGLHQRDTGQLIRVLRRLVNGGNSLLVVEHDLEVISAADHVVELGPGSGAAGGYVLFSGPAAGFAAADTLTSRSIGQTVAFKSKPRRSPKRFLHLREAKLHNLKNVAVNFGLGVFNCVSGVSGSGKSSLVLGVLKPTVEAVLSQPYFQGPGVLGAEIENCDQLDEVIVVSQSPIGKTPRSNPITYIKAFDHVRKLFAGTKAAGSLGLKAGDFSFNTRGGRCEYCKGAGYELIEMQFMADVFVACEACGGRRFNARALKVSYRGKTIAQVLEMTVNEAISFFSDQAGIGKSLWILQSVGLGYLKLGQSATTLSGGESQRLKIARQIAQGSTGRRSRGKLYILDEPTTGLHAVEVKKLLRMLDRLVDAGNTVIVVEHHPEVIAHADWLVDLGPEGGEAGGEVVFQGPPQEAARCKKSLTGAMLSGKWSGAAGTRTRKTG